MPQPLSLATSPSPQPLMPTCTPAPSPASVNPMDRRIQNLSPVRDQRAVVALSPPSSDRVLRSHKRRQPDTPSTPPQDLDIVNIVFHPRHKAAMMILRQYADRQNLQCRPQCPQEEAHTEAAEIASPNATNNPAPSPPSDSKSSSSNFISRVFESILSPVRSWQEGRTAKSAQIEESAKREIAAKKLAELLKVKQGLQFSENQFLHTTMRTSAPYNKKKSKLSDEQDGAVYAIIENTKNMLQLAEEEYQEASSNPNEKFQNTPCMHYQEPARPTKKASADTPVTLAHRVIKQIHTFDL